MKSPVTLLLVVIGTCGCTAEAADEPTMCRLASEHLAECTGSATASLACDGNSARRLLELTCAELGEISDAGKADGSCAATCAARLLSELDDPAAVCDVLCAGAIGDPCSGDEQCGYDGGYCHPYLSICTLSCEGLCPGANTFCVSEPLEVMPEDIRRTVGEHGICVRRANDTYPGCPMSQPSSAFESTDFTVRNCRLFECHALIVEMIDVPRFLGWSDAPADAANVCAPLVQCLRRECYTPPGF